MSLLLTPRYGRGSNPMTAEEMEVEDFYARSSARRDIAEYTKEELNRRESMRHKEGLKATIFELHIAREARHFPAEYDEALRVFKTGGK